MRGVPTRPTDLNESTPTNTPCLVLPVANVAEMSPEEAIFTRHMEPFLPACVVKILDLVQIGEDVTENQCDKVKLNIPKNTTFRTKIPQ